VRSLRKFLAIRKIESGARERSYADRELDSHVQEFLRNRDVLDPLILGGRSVNKAAGQKELQNAFGNLQHRSHFLFNDQNRHPKLIAKRPDVLQCMRGGQRCEPWRRFVQQQETWRWDKSGGQRKKLLLAPRE
jgi:hypothetical protein